MLWNAKLHEIYRLHADRWSWHYKIQNHKVSSIFHSVKLRCAYHMWWKELFPLYPISHPKPQLLVFFSLFIYSWGGKRTVSCVWTTVINSSSLCIRVFTVERSHTSRSSTHEKICIGIHIFVKEAQMHLRLLSLNRHYNIRVLQQTRAALLRTLSTILENTACHWRHCCKNTDHRWYTRKHHTSLLQEYTDWRKPQMMCQHSVKSSGVEIRH
jgi:hypothetical protein